MLSVGPAEIERRPIAKLLCNLRYGHPLDQAGSPVSHAFAVQICSGGDLVHGFEYLADMAVGVTKLGANGFCSDGF